MGSKYAQCQDCQFSDDVRWWLTENQIIRTHSWFVVCWLLIVFPFVTWLLSACWFLIVFHFVTLLSSACMEPWSVRLSFVQTARGQGAVTSGQRRARHGWWVSALSFGAMNITCIWMFPKRKMCAGTGNDKKNVPNQLPGEAVERVETYKCFVFLLFVFVCLLSCFTVAQAGKRTSTLYWKKANSRTYCLRKPRSFGVKSDVLVTFYNTVVCNFTVFGSVCLGWNISQFYRGRLETFVHVFTYDRKQQKWSVSTPENKII